MAFMADPRPILVFLAEALGLALIVLGLFRLRWRFGLTPLYVVLGVFQPIQAVLASTVYVALWHGMVVSPSTLPFGASLLALFLVYVREDALEARKLIYGVLFANLTMTILLWVVSRHLHSAGTLNLLSVDGALFSQGARVTAVGTVALVLDVLLLVVLYTAAGRLLPRMPVLRTWIALTGALVFDAFAFVTGAFFERPDYADLLAASVTGKAIVGTLYSLLAVGYLRYVEHTAAPTTLMDYPLRDVFYSLTYRDKFEAERAHRESELRQVFERITDAYIAIDPAGTVTYANAKAADIIGVPAAALVGRTVEQLVPREGIPLRMAIRKAMDTQRAVEIEEHYSSLGRWFESRVFPSANGVTVYFQDVTDRVAQRQGLERLATIDELTGLPNRAAMRGRIDRMLAERGDGTGGIALLNLDRLHQVNDTLGYGAGDAVLTQAAARLSGIAEAHHCVVGRVGGDDFALVCPGCNLEEVHRLATLATQALGEPFQFDGEPIYMTCSAGLTLATQDSDALRLLGESDLALNLAKQQGRNRVAAYSTEQARAIAHRVAITARMRDALDHGHFHFHLQPLVAAATGHITGAEALLRWTSPDMGVVSPADFISVAEETGFIVPLGDWVLHAVLALQAQWMREFGGARPISVNVSAVQLRRPTFEDDIRKALRLAGVPAEQLKLEITESAIMEDTPNLVAMLRRVRDSGVRISLDDFGTGYSSLALLRHLPIDEIKIDRVFVAGAMEDAYAATLCRAIITMSRELRFAVVAEGVETAEQAAFLRDAGCDTLQGFFYSRAVAPPDFRQFLLAGAPLR
ncbi:hypothetical protein LYSHEL_27760 [Lysobacter helvus]|uniref:EAL domain-containing protein n=2 Tax=Lysobacteraceae TaxID=32033 RepID=A0ABM7Q8P3_9GAMM|nr:MULTISPECIES: GGDEF domain-containing phosphodiesterase [Lysobacter]BCT93749.1 hypothetical protein LYSCAS_27730 [Lysobacter caseinilyticus]BCT96905.1 hypothetical protein LYSHEL_27760 [Lysobacter helvus]